MSDVPCIIVRKKNVELFEVVVLNVIMNLVLLNQARLHENIMFATSHRYEFWFDTQIYLLCQDNLRFQKVV